MEQRATVVACRDRAHCANVQCTHEDQHIAHYTLRTAGTAELVSHSEEYFAHHFTVAEFDFGMALFTSLHHGVL